MVNFSGILLILLDSILNNNLCNTYCLFADIKNFSYLLFNSIHIVVLLLLGVGVLLPVLLVLEVVVVEPNRLKPVLLLLLVLLVLVIVWLAVGICRVYCCIDSIYDIGSNRSNNGRWPKPRINTQPVLYVYVYIVDEYD